MRVEVLPVLEEAVHMGVRDVTDEVARRGEMAGRRAAREGDCRRRCWDVRRLPSLGGRRSIHASSALLLQDLPRLTESWWVATRSSRRYRALTESLQAATNSSSRSMLQRERSRLVRAGDRRAAPPSGARRPDSDFRGPLPRFLRSPSPTRPHQRRPQDLRGSHQIDAAARTLQIPSSRLGSERRLRPRNRRIPSCSAAALTPTPHRLQRHAGAAQTQDFLIFLGLLIWVFGRNLEIFVSDW
ncbi:unnamed protein product [Urochloa humidicola]